MHWPKYLTLTGAKFIIYHFWGSLKRIWKYRQEIVIYWTSCSLREMIRKWMFNWESPSQEQRTQCTLLTWDWRGHGHSWQGSAEPALGICCSHPVDGFILPITFKKAAPAHSTAPFVVVHEVLREACWASEQEGPANNKKVQLFKIWGIQGK